MMKKGVVLLGLGLLLLTACQPKEKGTATEAFADEHVAKNSLDYQQLYKGNIPHFKGEVVEGTLQLNSESSYTIRFGDPYAAVVSGSYTWIDGNNISIQDIDAIFRIEEGRVRVLPASGKKLSNGKTEEVLVAVVQKRNEDLFTGELTGPEWYITQFNGKEVKPFERGRAFLVFDQAEKRVGAFAGCNRMNGQADFTATEITISKVATTMMACQDMQLENELGKALEGTFAYEIKGKELHLKQKGKVVLVATYE